MKRSKVLQNAMENTAAAARSEGNIEPSRPSGAGGARPLPRGYVAETVSEYGTSVNLALKVTGEDAMNMKKRNLCRAVTTEGLPPPPNPVPQAKSVAKYGTDLLYLLDPEYFGVRNPNGEFHVLEDDVSNISIVPARNSWDWDRVRWLNIGTEARRFSQRIARAKLCQSQHVEVTSRADFTNVMPAKWKREPYWIEVFSGVYTDGEGETRPPIPYANIPSEECKVDPVAMHDSLYCHLLRSYNSRNGHIACLPKATLAPEIGKMPAYRNSTELHNSIVGVTYDMIRKLGDCCPTSKQKVVFNDKKNKNGGSGGGSSGGKGKGGKGGDSDDNFTIQITQLSPYTGTPFSKNFGGVEIPSAIAFNTPIMAYDNVIVPVSKPIFIRGGITFRKFDSASKTQETRLPSDFTAVAFNMEEMGKPSLALAPLTNDEVTVDFAIVLFKIVIESCLSPTPVAAVTNKKHGMAYMDSIVTKLNRMLFVPYIPNVDVHIHYPGTFKTGYSGKMKQDFISQAEWDRLITKPDFERTHRLLNREQFKETVGIYTQTGMFQLKQAFTCREDCTNANYMGTCLLSINFPVVNILHMRVEIGPSVPTRTIEQPPIGIADAVPVCSDIASNLIADAIQATTDNYSSIDGASMTQEEEFGFADDMNEEEVDKAIEAK